MAISMEMLSFLLYVIVYTPGILIGLIVNICNARYSHVSRPRAAVYSILTVIFALSGAKLGAIVIWDYDQPIYAN